MSLLAAGREPVAHEEGKGLAGEPGLVALAGEPGLVKMVVELYGDWPGGKPGVMRLVGAGMVERRGRTW